MEGEIKRKWRGPSRELRLKVKCDGEEVYIIWVKKIESLCIKESGSFPFNKMDICIEIETEGLDLPGSIGPLQKSAPVIAISDSSEEERPEKVFQER